MFTLVNSQKKHEIEFHRKNYNFLAVSVYANRVLLWVHICDATGCVVKALPMGQNIVLDKSYTKQLGQISILEHCKRQ